jgi:hypothetical protein
VAGIRTLDLLFQMLRLENSPLLNLNQITALFLELSIYSQKRRTSAKIGKNIGPKLGEGRWPKNVMLLAVPECIQYSETEHGCQIFLGTTSTKTEKIYPNGHKIFETTIKYTKGSKIDQMAIKFTNIFH